ncbi:hypothetical protein ES703_27330 [subsurface metagenome]
MDRKLTKLIHAAIEWKYGDRSLSDVREIVTKALEAFRKTTSEQSLLHRREPTVSFQTDALIKSSLPLLIVAHLRYDDIVVLPITKTELDKHPSGAAVSILKRVNANKRGKHLG